MDAEVYEALKEKLGDAVIKIGEEEKPLLDVVTYWEEGVEKTKLANKDLTTQREAWEKERRELKDSVTAATNLKTELEEKLEALQKKGGNNSVKEQEFEKQINALTDQINTLTESYKKAQEDAKAAKENALQANRKASEEGLRNDLITNLNKYNIKGSQAEDAIAIITSKGNAKLIQNSESGLYERSYCITKDGKQLAANLEQVCKWIAETRPYLVSSSGKQGTGANHTSNNPAATRARSYASMIAKRS